MFEAADIGMQHRLQREMAQQAVREVAGQRSVVADAGRDLAAHGASVKKS